MIQEMNELNTGLMPLLNPFAKIKSAKTKNFFFFKFCAIKKNTNIYTCIHYD